MTKTFDQIIPTKRMVRHLDATKPMTHEGLMLILEAGWLAPSAENFRPLRFVVVLSEEEHTKLHAISQQPWFYHAPSYVVIIDDHNKAWRHSCCDLTYVDTSIALTHMLLKAKNMELGTTTVVAFDQEICRELLQTPEHGGPILILAVGRPSPAFADKEGNPCRKAMEEPVTFI